jgi:hypothetical protein
MRDRSTRAARFIALHLGLAALFGVTAAGAIAEAQPAPVDRVTAEILFRDGKALLAEGKLAEACPKLVESHRIEPTAGTAINVAICHERQGKTATAWGDFMEAESLAASAKQPEREKLARERIAALEARLSKLRIEIAEHAPELVVKLDGRALSAAIWGSAIPVDPGDHVLEAAAPGRRAFRAKVVIDVGPSTQTAKVPRLDEEGAPPPAATTRPKEGATAPPAASGAPPSSPRVPPPAGPQASAPPRAAPPPSEPDASASRLRVAGFVAGGVGLAGVVLGSIFGARTFSKKAAGDVECDGRYCSQTGLDLHAEAETSATLSTVGFAVGIAGLGAGIPLVVMSFRSPPQPANASADHGRGRGAWLSPTVLAGGPALSAGGAF